MIVQTAETVFREPSLTARLCATIPDR